jgi:formylglycine-generating enzyme required for sulfatase activity
MLRAALLVAMMLVNSHPATRAAGTKRAGATRARIPAGSYMPLYAPAGAGRTHVSAFTIDREPVTRADFEAFVRAHAEWRRSAVKPQLAEPSYLGDWSSDVDAGPIGRQRPVANVSRFAANAYCTARGGRLPTVNEWEYVAAASTHSHDATNSATRRAELLGVYGARAGAETKPIGASTPNVYGVADLHELAWEWVDDVDRATMPDHARMSGDDAAAHHMSCASAALGATDATNYPAFLRYAFRAGLTSQSVSHALGFRCAGI